MGYIALIFVGRWRHNFREIAVKNCENPKNRRKSVCAPLRIDSWRFWKKNLLQQFRAETVDVHLYNFFSARRYICWQQVSNFVSVVQKRLGMNKFVRTKSHIGSKFSKIFFEQLYTGWIVHLYFSFSLWRQMAPQQSAKFFGQFRTSLRKDSVANYEWIWTRFSTSARGRYFVTH